MRAAREHPALAASVLAWAICLAMVQVLLVAGEARAQDACMAEVEPNDAPDTAPHLTGPACVTGLLSQDDQDLVVWDVPPSAATQRWAFEVDGVPGVLTRLQVFPVTSGPSTLPLEVGSEILDVSAPPQAATGVADDVLLEPGRYVLGISRSDDQGEPPPDEAYRFSIGKGDPWPGSGDAEPNDDPASAVPVTDGFEVSGDMAGSVDLFEWTVGAHLGQWHISLDGPLESPASVDLLAQDSTEIEGATGQGAADLYDLGLAPGTYLIRVGRSSGEARPYVLRAALQESTFDPEPNDAAADAVPVDDGTAVIGRLARTSGDTDHYRISVPPGSRSLRDIRLFGQGETERQLCLLDTDGRDIVCQSGDRGAALPDLLLAPGDHLVEVRGRADPDEQYLLRVDVTAEARADYETEPNDEPALASPLDLGLGVRGRSDRPDPDYFRASVEGDPQLWQIVADGPLLDRISWVTAEGTELATRSPEPGASQAVLTDVYLIPGTHHFRVRTFGGEYAVVATPLGPPDPDAEREPNSELVRAEPYRVGQRRVGRLVDTADIDFYRFTAAAPEHLAIRLEQPSEASLELSLEADGQRLQRVRSKRPGAALELDLWLAPGEYEVRLKAVTPSADHYTLTSERLDPFSLAADQEPNNEPAFARPVPATLRWAGEVSDRTQADWFELPALETPTPLRVEVQGQNPVVHLMAGSEDRSLPRLEPGVFVAEQPPVGVPLYLRIIADGSYAATITADGLAPVPEPDAPELVLVPAFETIELAAYWPRSQRVDGRLRLTNESDDAVELELDAATSHFAWHVSFEDDEVLLPPGESASVIMAINVDPDVRAEPVGVTVRARTPQGGQATASLRFAATPDARPVGSGSPWDLPDELLGGLNVAALGIGGEPLGLTDVDKERQLFDGVTPAGGGFFMTVDELPVEIAVDLAGVAAVPVAGIVIDPSAREGRTRDTPQAFSLALSSDGTSWSEVLRSELSPLPIPQAFTLETPTLASHAMLRLDSIHAGGSAIALGEWKVIAIPGEVPDQMPANIADPARGGHVVRLQPFSVSQDSGSRMLDSVPDEVPLYLGADAAFDVVIGFQDGRAAQITSIEWQDPEGSGEVARVEGVDVSLATESPLGPWEAIGSWDLERDASGIVAPFGLPQPAWARYVRLTSSIPEEGTFQVEAPATIGIIERATDDDYRSVLGEWGHTSRLGPFEWSSVEQPMAVPGAPDAGDTMATATPLEVGKPRSDRVEIDQDEDWYSIDVPARQQALILDVGGTPPVSVRLSLFDESGEARPMTFRVLPGGTVRYEAVVEPGRSYAVRVQQPPFSVVFAFDTSGSMGPFLDFVREGMRAFARDVQPGREAVLVQPFEEAARPEGWSDQPYVLEDVVNSYVPLKGSSGVEAGLIAASDLLATREGARAILVVTDAETGTFELTPELWSALDAVRPTIFSVHIGGATQPVVTRQRMQDWAASSGGHYTQPTTHSDMDRAFERMATWLRRPASYTLGAETTDVRLEPGTLSVSAPPDGGGAGVTPNVGIEIILDTSGSMRKKLAGKRRIDIAKDALDRLVREALPEGVPLALRTFGGKGSSRQATCETRLRLPLGPLDRTSTIKKIRKLEAQKKTRTPIGAALAAVADDLAGVSGPRTIVLVTDGAETCKGDPEAAIEALQASGVDVHVNIVGFALDDEALKAEMALWAQQGDGTFFDAVGAAELADSIATALNAPFRVVGPAGQAIAGGTVGGNVVELDPGTYRVEVLVDPPVVFDDVVVGAGESIEVVLGPELDDG